ncbi:MAG: Uma2 family endonuclease [Bryobacteraceae bacterium]
MSTTALMPVEEYLRLTEKPYCEYRDGVVSPRAMPTKFHAIIQYALLMMLRAQGVLPLPELTVRLSPTRYLVPDVSVAGDFPGPYPTDPVLLCCEILSPEDRLGTTFAKCEEYHAWGVPFCWIIDPEKRTAWEYHANSEPVRAAGSLRAGDLAVNLEELFAALDAPR